MTTTRANVGRGVMLACIALAACSCSGTATPAGSPEPPSRAPLSGVHWRLQSADGPAGSTVFPTSVDGWLELTTAGAIRGSDGCGIFSATSHGSKHLLRLSRVTETANGCIRESGPLKAMRRGVDQALLSEHPARVALTPQRLVVRGSGYVLTYIAAGPATHGPGPSPQTSTTGGGA